MRGKATVLVKPNQLETWDLPISDPEPGGALVRTLVGGVCGSDVHIANGEAGVMPFPIILGHEGVGKIEKLGEGVETDYAGVPVVVGDLVVWSPILTNLLPYVYRFPEFSYYIVCFLDMFIDVP